MSTGARPQPTSTPRPATRQRQLQRGGAYCIRYLHTYILLRGCGIGMACPCPVVSTHDLSVRACLRVWVAVRVYASCAATCQRLAGVVIDVVVGGQLSLRPPRTENALRHPFLLACVKSRGEVISALVFTACLSFRR